MTLRFFFIGENAHPVGLNVGVVVRYPSEEINDHPRLSRSQVAGRDGELHGRRLGSEILVFAGNRVRSVVLQKKCDNKK